MRDIKRIIVHHTATPKSMPVEAIRYDHINVRGWQDIGYHYLIDYGKIEGIFYERVRLGRPIHLVGAHCKGHNEDSIGVAVIGDYRRISEDLFNPVILGLLLEDLCRQYPGVKILGHQELASTLCPGEKLMDWLKQWRRERDKERER